MRPSCLLLLLTSVAAAVVALSLLPPARCQPQPPAGVIGRAPPPIARVIEGAPPLPSVQQPQQDLEKELRSVSDKLTAELQSKYGFCMADVYVP